MAPEIENGESFTPIDADLFALAVMIFVMVTHSYPFDQELRTSK